MGTDIHTVAQIKDRNGKWETVAENIANEWRSYHSYAVLANLRNGHGFAGSDTGEEWEYISEPRGFPDDFEETNYEHIYGFDKHKKWMGDHSHSWVTLKEIKDKLEYYSGKKYEVHGIVEVEKYRRLLEGVEPDEWCSGISGPDIVVVDENNINETATHVRIKWKVDALSRLTYLKNCVRHIELLKDCDYNDKLTDEDVRMVFGFDS